MEAFRILCFFLLTLWLGSCAKHNGRSKPKNRPANDTTLGPESKQAIIRPAVMMASQRCDPSCCYYDALTASSNSLDYYVPVPSNEEIFDSLRGIRFGTRFNPSLGSQLGSYVIKRRVRPPNGAYMMDKEEWRRRHPYLSRLPFWLNNNYNYRKVFTYQPRKTKMNWSKLEASHKSER